MAQPKKKEQPQEELLELPLELIHRREDQPRRHFDQEELEVLAESLNRDGQEIRGIVRPHPTIHGHYELIDGERRWRALKLGGIDVMKVIVTYEAAEDARAFRKSFIGNTHRRDLHLLETAQAMKQIMEDEGLTIREIASMIGKSSAHVSNYLALLTLDPDVKKLLDPSLPEKQQLGYSIATVIASVPSDLQLEVARFAMERGTRFGDIRSRIDHILDSRGIDRPIRRRRGHETLRTHMSRLNSVMAERFNTMEHVQGSYYIYGHLSLEDMKATVALAEEVSRKLQLFSRRLKTLIEKKER